MNDHNLRLPGRSLAAAVLLLSAWAPLSCNDSPGGKDTTQQDEGYVLALAAADEFCHAWQTGSFADAKALMSRRLVQQVPEQKLADLIAGTSNPAHVSYEISDGLRQEDGRIVFRVRLFLLHVGKSGKRVQGPADRIAMVAEEGRWRVDEFPMAER